MSCDRFVCWQKKKPTREEIFTILKDHIHLSGKVREFKNGYEILLSGRSRSPFYTIRPGVREIDEARFPEGRNLRLIEVWVAKDSLDIITRQADEFTNVVAEGIAKLFARYYEGRLEQG